ncbi:MAG: type II toxin-antitoxin system VapC family toxin [Chloroflexota bacterium]
MKRLYWDACVFLSYVNGHVERAPMIENVLQDARDSQGLVEIVTATISLTEVAGGITVQGRTILTSEIEEKIDLLWADHSVVMLVELHQSIALEARRLVRAAHDRAWQLKPMDAIHLATAVWIRASEFSTYDGGLKKYEDLIRMPIQEPFSPNRRLL